MNKILIIGGLILGLGGIMFALLPANIHMAIFGGESMDDMNDMDMQDNMDTHDSMEESSEHIQLQDHAGSHNHGAFVTYGLVVGVVGFALTIAGWKIFN